MWRSWTARENEATKRDDTQKSEFSHWRCLPDIVECIYALRIILSGIFFFLFQMWIIESVSLCCECLCLEVLSLFWMWVIQKCNFVLWMHMFGSFTRILSVLHWKRHVHYQHQPKRRGKLSFFCSPYTFFKIKKTRVELGFKKFVGCRKQLIGCKKELPLRGQICFCTLPILTCSRFFFFSFLKLSFIL